MRAVITALIVSAMLYGCGYKGPLYLPQDKPEPQAAKPAAKPQQEPQKPATGSGGQ